MTLQGTIHHHPDGSTTVSYFSVYAQTWHKRVDIRSIAAHEVASMPEPLRSRVITAQRENEMMTVQEAIQAALTEPEMALTGGMVARDPQGGWDFFFAGTPPHHYEDGRLVKWDIEEGEYIQISSQLAAEAQGMDEDKLEQIIDELADEVPD